MINLVETGLKILASQAPHESLKQLITFTIELQEENAQKFPQYFSMLSRYFKSQHMMDYSRAPYESDFALWAKEKQLSQLELARLILLFSHKDLESSDFQAGLEQLFSHADQGETIALYLALPWLPDPGRFLWRANEACRTNIIPVFEAIACESEYPAAHFDKLSWNQLVLKAAFLELPLWRIRNFDERLNDELCRMALDYMDERTSAGRDIPVSLWLAISGDKHLERSLARIQWASSQNDPSLMLASLMTATRLGNATTPEGAVQLLKKFNIDAASLSPTDFAKVIQSADEIF